MDTVDADRGLCAFRATDAFAVEAYRTAAELRGDALAIEIRRTAIAAGAAVVAAAACRSTSGDAARHLERARDALIEGRYFLYLARRFGLLDARRYRGLSLRQDSALREIEASRPSAARPRAP
jgi:four helix bundle protein